MLCGSSKFSSWPKLLHKSMYILWHPNNKKFILFFDHRKLKIIYSTDCVASKVNYEKKKKQVNYVDQLYSINNKST